MHWLDYALCMHRKNTILKQYLYVYHMWKRVVLSRANNSRTTYANNNSNAMRIKVPVVHC